MITFEHELGITVFFEPHETARHGFYQVSFRRSDTERDPDRLRTEPRARTLIVLERLVPNTGTIDRRAFTFSNPRLANDWFWTIVRQLSGTLSAPATDAEADASARQSRWAAVRAMFQSLIARWGHRKTDPTAPVASTPGARDPLE